MDQHQLQEMVVPMSAVSKTLGCAFDIGGTQCKVVYRSKEAPTEEGCKLHLLTVSSRNLTDCLSHVINNAALDQKPDRVVHTTGVGVQGDVKAALAKELKARVENLAEPKCFGDAFIYLVEHFCKDIVVLPPPDRGYKEGNQLGQEIRKLLSVGNSQVGQELESRQHHQIHPQESDSLIEHKEGFLPYKQADPHLFPCLICSMGSAVMFNVVEADGNLRFVDCSGRCGKYLLGLACLGLDVGNYDDLMELAEKGDDHNVNEYMKEFKLGEPSEFYSFVPDDLIAHALGKATPERKDNFKRADLAKAILTNFLNDLAQHLFWIAKAHGCKRVFAAGGVCKHPLVRNLLMKNFILHNFFVPPSQSEVELHCLRFGTHMIALGALLHNENYYQNLPRKK